MILIKHFIYCFFFVLFLVCCSQDWGYIEIQPSNEICEKVKCLIRNETDPSAYKHPYKDSSEILFENSLCPCKDVSAIIEYYGLFRKKFYGLKKGKVISFSELSLDEHEQEFKYINDRLAVKKYNDRDSIIYKYNDKGNLTLTEYNVFNTDTIFNYDSLQVHKGSISADLSLDSTIFKNNKVKFNHFFIRDGEGFSSFKNFYEYNLNGDFVSMTRKDTVKKLHEKYKYYTYFSNYCQIQCEYSNINLPIKYRQDLVFKGDTNFYEANYKYGFFKNESGNIKVEISKRIYPKDKEIVTVFYLDSKLNWYKKYVYENKVLNYKQYRKCIYD